ncbi:MAG: NUDIX domain-containing protein [Bacteroidota bacterium]
MEIWDLYDHKLKHTGKTIVRGSVIPIGYYHLVVHFWLKNSEDYYLIQKRSDKVEYKKGIWSFTGGSAITGENSEEAVIREVKEEIGLTVRKEDIKIVNRYCRGDYWVDIYLMEKDVSLSEFKVGHEVTSVKYASQSEIWKMRSEGLFWDLDEPYLKNLFSH